MRWCLDSPQGFGLPMIWLETWANCKTILECFKVLNYVACFEHAGLPIVLLINFFAHRNYNLHPEKQHKNGKPLSFPEEIHLQIVDVHGPFQSHVGFPEHSNMSPPHGDVFFFFLSTRFHFWSQVGLNFRRCAHCPAPSMGKQTRHCKQHHVYFMIVHP